MPSRKKQELTVEGRPVFVSNLEKPLYPVIGFTKAQVIDYYIRVSPYLLPHLKDRPVTLKRYPDGVGGDFFYEKDAPSFTPEWVATYPVPRRGGGRDIRYILINDLPTLVWSANLANLEIHPFLHRVPKIETPTFLVFDLDPGDGADILLCAEVAFLLRDVLQGFKLEAFPKVSGSKGLQVYVPLNSTATYETTQPFARALAQLLEREHPHVVVSEMAKSARTNKIFIDWSQNSDFKTTVGVYSLRAKRSYPFASLPVTWEELDHARKERDSGSLYWQAGAALERLEKVGDLFAPVLTLAQTLPADFTARMQRGVRARAVRSPKPLATYEAKRDFAITAEPAPAKAKPRRSRQGGRRRFVIQKHAASHLHFDFRLEMHDVLKSWAVPKGIPYGLDDKRLAMATEDHPLDYLDFEGTIPQGQYGGGTVMVWDIGTYDIIDGNYWKGRVRVFLDGKKLKGEWTLARDSGGPPNKWSLIKTGEPLKALSAKKENVSAVSGRTMEQIADANDRVWQSNRAPAAIEADLAALPAVEMKFIDPMRAQLVNQLPDEPGWEYEIKLDGYRCLALRDDTDVVLLSRNEKKLNSRFPAVAKCLEALPPQTILDGEIVALDENGKPSFHTLQNRRTSTLPVFYYVFDCIAYRGKSLVKLPLTKRREILSSFVLQGIGDPVRNSQSLQASAPDLIAAAREQHLEGLIAKRSNSSYESGQRSGAWVKFKTDQGQELVIGGYLPGKHGFDSLLVGYYEGDKLLFIGKVKNGFTPKIRQDVAARFGGLGTPTPPFGNLPEPKNARRGEALTVSAMKKYCWLRPKLVAQIEFTDWTEANHLRHSRFVTLRDDKDPREVTREAPVRDQE